MTDFYGVLDDFVLNDFSTSDDDDEDNDYVFDFDESDDTSSK